MVVISELPTDVLMNIQSYLLGKPEDFKIKHNKKFHELQRLFKIHYEYDLNNVYHTIVRSSYVIRGIKLNPNILLKQKRKLKRLRLKTFNVFKTNMDLSSSDRYGSRKGILSRGDNLETLFDETLNTDYYDSNVLYSFLQMAKMEIENSIRYYNCKIYCIDLCVSFHIIDSESESEED